MSHLPRFAVGSVHESSPVQPAVWALLGVFRRQEWQVQTFLPTAYAEEPGLSQLLTGQLARHLDSWLMSPATCRRIFAKWSRDADLSLVHGAFDVARSRAESGGSLDELCDWLELPRLAVIDVSRLEACRLPPRPRSVDGIILDRVPSSDEAIYWATCFESLWGVPVVAQLMDGEFRRFLAEVAAGRQELCRATCGAGGPRLELLLDLDRLLQMARAEASWRPSGGLEDADGPASKLNIAVAVDDAFRCCGVDTLDILEGLGARICDFSPLHDDRLPAATDLVYLGCGHVERYAGKLAANHCIHQALRQYVRAGGRVFAEGGGLAYLCRQMIIDQRRRFRLSGVLPADAFFASNCPTPYPIEMELRRNRELALGTRRIRGYLDGRWKVRPLVPMETFAKDPQHRFDLLRWRGVVGSRLHFHLGAQPALLPLFLPTRCRL